MTGLAAVSAADVLVLAPPRTFLQKFSSIVWGLHTQEQKREPFGNEVHMSPFRG